MIAIATIVMALCVISQFGISIGTKIREARIKKYLDSMVKINDGFCLMLKEHLKQIDRMEKITEDFLRSQDEGEEWKR